MDISDLWTTDNKFDMAKAATTALGAAALYGALNPDSGIAQFTGMGSSQRPVGYTGGIPEYEVSRSLLPDAFAQTTATGEPRRPGSAGRRYFTDTTYTPTGNVMSATTAPVDTTPQTQAPGIYSALPEEAVVALLQNMFGSGGVGGTTGGTAEGSTTPNINWQTVAGNIRSGASTPASTMSTINTTYPTAGYTEEDVVFNLLDQGLTTPQEVSDYYGGRFTPEEVSAAYSRLGGTKTFAGGGLASLSGSRGYYLGGATDGMSDRIPATINATEPAALSDGEFVIPADVVSHLGNGNSDAGAQKLYSMMDRVRQARTGRREQGRRINPNKYLPV